MKRLFLVFAISSSPLLAAAQNYTDSITMHRAHYKQEFVTDEHSPLTAADTAYLQFYPANEQYRVLAKFKRADSTTFNMKTHTGVNKKYREYGTLQFNIKGKNHVLHVYQSIALMAKPGFEDYLFIPFTDETNVNQTYGGGRYIDLKIGDIQNGTVLLDFNKCYNPYCAYEEGYACPIPPRENSLPIAIPAGERRFGKEPQ